MFFKAFILALPFILYVTSQPFIIDTSEQDLVTDFQDDLHNIEFVLIRNEKEQSKIKVESPKLEGPRTYVLGQRESGDALVGKASKNQKYPKEQDVHLTIAYPTSGTGKLVTYVEIFVNQTSDLGRAYVVAGGYHQHMVKIVVEAFQTTQMDYNAAIYGK